MLIVAAVTGVVTFLISMTLIVFNYNSLMLLEGKNKIKVHYSFNYYFII